MSYSEMYALKKGGEILACEEYRNAHGTGPFVWSALSEKLFGDEFLYSRMGEESSIFGSCLPEHLKGVNFWSVWRTAPWKDRLTEWEKATFIATFDRAVVKRENLEQLVADFMSFWSVHGTGTRANRACHFKSYAEKILEWIKEFGDELWGVCWYGCSVGENLWEEWIGPEKREWDKTKDGAYDPETGEMHEDWCEWEGYSQWYDFADEKVGKRGGHYFVYDMLKEAEEEDAA